MDEDPRLYGWIEVLTTTGTWGAWRKVQAYLKRPHPIEYFLLFGIGDGALGWTPAAPGRGIPADLSDVALRSQRLFAPESYGQTWITLAEIETARQQCSARWDDRVHYYQGYRQYTEPREWIFTGPPQRLKVMRDLDPDQQTLLDLGLPVTPGLIQSSRYIREPLEADYLLSEDYEWRMLLKDLRDQRAVYKDIRLVVAFQEFA